MKQYSLLVVFVVLLGFFCSNVSTASDIEIPIGVEGSITNYFYTVSCIDSTANPPEVKNWQTIIFNPGHLASYARDYYYPQMDSCHITYDWCHDMTDISRLSTGNIPDHWVFGRNVVGKTHAYYLDSGGIKALSNDAKSLTIFSLVNPIKSREIPIIKLISKLVFFISFSF